MFLWLQNLSIRRKVLLIGILPSLLALMMACGTFVAIELNTYRDDVVIDLRNLAKVLGTNCNAALEFGDNDAANETLATLRVNRNIQAACVFDADGNRFACYLADGVSESVLPQGPKEDRTSEFTTHHAGVFATFSDAEQEAEGQDDDSETVSASNTSEGLSLDENDEKQATIFLLSDLEQLNERVSRYLYATLAVVVFFLIVCVFVAKRLQKSITTPLTRVVEKMQAIAKGNADLTSRMEIASRDEIGQLAQSFNDFVDTIRSIVMSVGSTTAGLSTASEEIRGASNQLDSDVDEACSEIARLRDGVDEIAKNAVTARDVANKAVQETQSTTETVTQLNLRSTEIGEIVKLIGSVAEQTNLLALNASIEAANAGDAGKGFAVVANEVKELANTTARASEDIRQRIQKIRDDTQGTVNSINRISDIIGSISSLQNDISSRIGTDRPESGREAAEPALDGSISRVLESAQGTSTNATATKSSADEIATMAHQLQRLVDQFRY